MAPALDVSMTEGESSGGGEEGSEGEEEAPYACPECPAKSYANPDSLRKHAKAVHDMVLAYCRECRLAFKTAKAKDAHMAKAHGEVKPAAAVLPAAPAAKPQEQPQPSSRKRKLSSEVDDQEAGDGGEYLCPKCPRRYGLQASLRKHCFRQHNHLVIKICRSCPQVFKNQRAYEVHTKKCGNQPPSPTTPTADPSPAAAAVQPVRIPFTKQASIKSFITPLGGGGVAKSPKLNGFHTKQERD